MKKSYTKHIRTMNSMNNMTRSNHIRSSKYRILNATALADHNVGEIRIYIYDEHVEEIRRTWINVLDMEMTR